MSISKKIVGSCPRCGFPNFVALESWLRNIQESLDNWAAEVSVVFDQLQDRVALLEKKKKR